MKNTIKILIVVTLLAGFGCQLPKSEEKPPVTESGHFSVGSFRSYTVRLTGFDFPSDLSPKHANFRMVVDLRLVNPKGEFEERSVVLPGLESYWECNPNKSDHWNYVGIHPKDPSPNAASTLNLARVGVWDTRIFQVHALAMKAIRFRVYDVDRDSWWDRFRDVLIALPSAFLVQSARAVEAGVAAAVSQNDKIKLLFQKAVVLTMDEKYQVKGEGHEGNYKIRFALQQESP